MPGAYLQIEDFPQALMNEVESVARAQQRSVREVVTEALERYIKEMQWQSLKAYGRERARMLGLTEADVSRLVAESRRERKQRAG